jgi:Glycosyltransferase 61
MQQLYACYSFYQQFALSNPKVFVIPSQLQKQLDTNPFLHGFIRFLRDEVKVKIISPSDVESSEYLSPANTFSPGGYILSHTAELNRQILNVLSIPEDLNGSCSDDVLKPRIGILNRRPALGRSLKDTDRLVNILKDLSRDNSVSVEYFEGSSFADQVGFFRRIDIMLSPHGAQNTGIPFMANKKCAHILEVFPDKYLLPTFYGSLARNSGIGYSYVYMSARDERTGTNDDLSFAGRVQARAANICLSSEVIREYVASLAEDWRTCCREQ